MGKKTRSNQSGQAITEYILLLSIVVGLFVAILGNFTNAFYKITLGLGGKMELQMRTGRAPATLWTK